MSYRTRPRPKPEPRRTMQKTATPSKVYVHNGSTFELAIPCWYLIAEPPTRVYPHDRDFHNHVGWPRPDRPDHSCQLYTLGWHTEHEDPRFLRHLLDMDTVEPIHLKREGYNEVSVNFADELPDGVSANGWIDDEYDWVIRIRFDVNAPFEEKEHRYRFSAFVMAPETESLNSRRDLVCLGELIIVPSAPSENV